MSNFCGTSEITGARFSIYPMSDRFVDIIKSALEEVDTSKVWMETDDVSTCVRGRSEHVFDVALPPYDEERTIHRLPFYGACHHTCTKVPFCPCGVDSWD
jgi:uncharacterized protein YqgV (UPF0045/DUF77 family)